MNSDDPTMEIAEYETPVLSHCIQVLLCELTTRGDFTSKDSAKINKLLKSLGLGCTE